MNRRARLWIVAACARLAPGCVNEVELSHAPEDIAGPTHWTTVASTTTRDLHRVWGTADDDVWAVGDEGTAIHWNGFAWSTIATGTTASLTGVWAAQRDDAWTVGATATNELALLHWDGTRWSDVALPTRDRVVLRALWGSGAGDVWAVGGTNDTPDPPLWHRSGDMWRPEFMPGMHPSSLWGVAGRGADEVWVVGQGPALFHRSAGAWAMGISAPRGVLLGGELCVAGDGAVWATSATNAVHRYRGGAWDSFTLATGTSLRGLWCSADHVWGVGAGGRVAHWNGSAWSSEDADRVDLAAVWGSDAGGRWAVGARGTVLHNGP